MPANAPMPSRATRSSTEAGAAYRAARWRSSRTGRVPLGRPPSCSITPTRARWSASARQGSRPRTRTVPPSGRCSPSAHSIEVVLPAPFGPRTAVTCPAEADHVMPSTARWVPKRRTSSCTVTAWSTPRSLGRPPWVTILTGPLARLRSSLGGPSRRNYVTLMWCLSMAVTPSAPSDCAPHGLEARTRDRVSAAISEHGPITAADLGRRLGLTPAAVRRHLDALASAGGDRGARAGDVRAPPRPSRTGLRRSPRPATAR